MKKPSNLRTAFAVYTVQDCIGEGGSGLVYSALDDTGVAAAVKVLNSKQATGDKLKRFKNEYKFCSRSRHPNIIIVLDHGLTDTGDPFFVMPLYDYSLRKIVGKVEPKLTFELFAKLLDGVEAAHKLGVVHRDIKPENILISNNGKNLVVADFGIARFEEEELFTAVETKDSSRLANFQYAAPEQRTRGKDVDHRADIYALGLMLNELFTSELAHGINFKKIKSVSSEYEYLDLIVDKMLQHDPLSRYQNIDDIKKELIVRGKEHIARQEVDRLKTTVIATTDVDDPLIDDPMKIVNVDWKNNVLSIQLNHVINDNWKWAINNMGGYSSVLGKGPEDYRFSGNKASISVSADDVQRVLDYFNKWLPRANRVYEDKIRKDRELAERKTRQELKAQIEREEERSNVLKNLKF